MMAITSCDCKPYSHHLVSDSTAVAAAATSSLASTSTSTPSPALSLSPSTSASSLAPSTSSRRSLTTEKQQQQQHPAVDLTRLNSLLSQLSQPSASRVRHQDQDQDTPSSSPTPRLRGNGALREPAHRRAQRKARFLSLLDTFHRATICDFEPSTVLDYRLSASDLLHSLDPQPQPTSPNDVLRGVASSMAEPPTTQQASAENLGKLIQASAIAAPYQEAIKTAIAERVAAGKTRPKLVGILAKPSPPSVAYAEWTRKACEAVGIEFDIWRTWDDAAPTNAHADAHAGSAPDFDLEADVEDLIIAANADDSVHGIMVYYPIFHGRQDTYLQQIVDPRKDVEGLHFSYCWNMYHNVRFIAPSQLGGAPGTTREMPAPEGDEETVPAGMAKSILPCTPLAMVKCLESIGVYDRSLPYGDRLFGKTIAVINRSEVVGRPLAALLSNDGARVLSIDIDSIQEFNKRTERERSAAVRDAHERNAAARLRPHHVVRASSLSAEECIRSAHVVIAGVPSPNYKVPTDWIQPGTVCINFSSEKNFMPDVRTKASMYLPAIGKTTIAMLQRNLLRLVEYRELAQSSSSSK